MIAGRMTEAIRHHLRPNDVVVLGPGAMAAGIAAADWAPASRVVAVRCPGASVAVGLGLALCRLEARVIAVDAAGDVLGQVGALATVGMALPANLYHVVIELGSGLPDGSERASARVELEQIAWGCGYARADRVESEEHWRSGLDALFATPGPSMMVA